VSRARTLKIQLVRTDRTDLCCISCGRFKTEFAVARADGEESQAGVHRKCLDDVKVRRATKATPEAATEGAIS
jgi:hypothetical protein